MDKPSIKRAITKVAYEIIEQNQNVKDLVLVGVNNKGGYLAGQLSDCIKASCGKVIPWCGFDITYFRDDVDSRNLSPDTLLVSVINKTVIIVDDLLNSGRTTRAAIDGIMYYGRPKAIQLAVLIDCGHRELPIRPDFVGKHIPVAKNEKAIVKLEQKDDNDGVFLKKTK